MNELPALDQMMLHIKVLDPNAMIRFSEYTHKWFVTASIEIGGDGILRGIAEHQPTPTDAVFAYFEAITNVPLDRYLVTYSSDHARRQWRWNGAAFAEVPL